MKKILLSLVALLAVMTVSATDLLSYSGTSTLPSGITISGTTTMKSVKIHANKDAQDCIQLANGYTTSGVLGVNYIALGVEGGFKAGDVVSITGFFSNTSDTKTSAVDLFVKDDSEQGFSVLWTSEQFINARTVADDPTAQTFTLTADADSLFLGRNGNTGTNIMALSVTRSETTNPTVVETKTYTVDPVITVSYEKSGKDATLDEQNVDVNKMSDDTYQTTIPSVTVSQETTTMGTASMQIAATDIKDLVMTPSAEKADSFLVSLKDGAAEQTIGFTLTSSLMPSTELPGSATINKVNGYQYGSKLYLVVSADFTVSLFGKSVSGDMSVVYNPQNVAPVLTVADFENIEVPATGVKYFEGATPSVDWTSGSYTFSTYKDSYGYYYSYAVSNKTTTDGKCSYPFAFESACGGAKSGSNYVVWYDNTWNGGDSIVLAQEGLVSGVYVTNTSSVVDAILNGDGYDTTNPGFHSGDNYTVTFTGYDENGVTGSKSFRLAYGEGSTVYYAKDWMWVDLAALGTVKYIKVTVSSTKSNAYGVTTPLYFCLDDFGGVAPETDVPYTEAQATAVNAIEAAGAEKVLNGKFFKNGQVIIIKNGKQYNAAGVQMK